jgi:hypothetical protein
MLQTPSSLTEWVVNSGASNHMTLDPDNISLSLSTTESCCTFIHVVGNGSVILVTSVGNTILPGPFYLNIVLVTPDIIKNLLFVHQFITDNWCSMKFDPFGLSVKDLATRNMITRCNSFGPLYTIYLPSTCSPQVSTYYALTVATIPMPL